MYSYLASHVRCAILYLEQLLSVQNLRLLPSLKVKEGRKETDAPQKYLLSKEIHCKEILQHLIFNFI